MAELRVLSREEMVVLAEGPSEKLLMMRVS